MPRSNGRPKSRQPKHAHRKTVPTCQCGGKPTKYGLCVRCLDDPMRRILLQAHGVYLPSRNERRTY